MSVSVYISSRKKICCPKCGEVAGYVEVDSTSSVGRVWYDFLEAIGYYVPHDQLTEENDWYGKDMVLSPEQSEALYRYVRKMGVYNAGAVAPLVADALAEKNDIVISADW